MNSTRHAIVALTLPFILGAFLVFNLASERWAFAGVLFVALLGFVGFEVWLSGRRQRIETRRRWDAQKRAGYPLWSVTGEQDRLWEQLERRRVG